MTINEMRVERRKLWEQAKGILDFAEDAKRDLTAEENAHYGKLEAEMDRIQTDINKAQEKEDRSKKMDAIGAEFEKPKGEAIKPEPERRDEDPIAMNPILKSPEYAKVFARAIRSTDMGTYGEVRATIAQMDSDIAGGYLVAPQQFVTTLIQALKNQTVVRGLSTVYSVPKAESLGAPALDNDVDDPTWTSEILTGSDDTALSFGKRELYPHPMAARKKVSKKLLRSSALNVDAIVRDRLAYKAGIVEENAFLNGTGANQPLGVFVVSADGISTSRDVSTGNTITSIKTDGLIEAKYTMLPGYWSRARWIFHRDAIKQIRKLKDGDGQYVWKPGITNDRGDTILDIPVLMSEYAPNTFTTGLYVGILGDFSNYWIADALDMTVEVLTELYAEANQNGYILRKETDGMPVLEEAFVRVTLA